MVTVVLVTLSLNHLAYGLQGITGDSPKLSWALAIVIDCGMLMSEAALIVASIKKFVGIKEWAFSTLIPTLILSATLNSLSYLQMEVTGTFKVVLCIFLGSFIPFMAFAQVKQVVGLLVGLKGDPTDANEIRELREFLVQRKKFPTAKKMAAAMNPPVHPSQITRRINRARELGLIH